MVRRSFPPGLIQCVGRLGGEWDRSGPKISSGSSERERPDPLPPSLPLSLPFRKRNEGEGGREWEKSKRVLMFLRSVISFGMRKFEFTISCD